VPYVSQTLEDTSKTYEMKVTVEKLCKIVSLQIHRINVYTLTIFDDARFSASADL
jgi:hypothetical protein